MITEATESQPGVSADEVMRLATRLRPAIRRYAAAVTPAEPQCDGDDEQDVDTPF